MGESPAYRNDGVECFNAVVLDPDGNSVEAVHHDSHAQDGIPESRSLVAWKSLGSAALDALAGHGGISRPENARRSSASAASSLSRRAPLIPGIVRSLTDPLLLREASGGEVSDKTLVGTMLGAAAGAAIVYAMCKSEEESARAEWEYERALAGRTRPRIKMVDLEQESVGGRSSGSRRSRRRRNSLPAIEAPPEAPMPPSGRYEPPPYESVVGGRSRMGREDGKSRLSVSRSTGGPAAEDVYYERSRSHKSCTGNSNSAMLRAGSRSDRHEKPLLALPPPPEKYFVEGLEDARTVVPSDSVSCAGSRRHRPRSHKSSSSKHKSRFEKAERLDRVSEARSESTITPKKYHDARIRYSLPVRDRDGDVWRRSVVSYAG